VQVQLMDNWTAAWSSSQKFGMVPALNDIVTLLQVVVRVIMDNLGNFMAALDTSPQSAGTPAA
jgi:hypothetical protein